MLKPHILPVRPNPACTSSKINRAPCALHHLHLIGRLKHLPASVTIQYPDELRPLMSRFSQPPPAHAA